MTQKSYAIWNNKGGVGKSFLSFILATEWAHKNPDARVLVIDTCPQANVSEILLGGNGIGHKNLVELIDDNKTIGGYFSSRINSPHTKTGDEKNFAVLASKYNKEIPSNLYLVAGDPALELQVQTINNIAVQELPLESWKNVHSWVRDLSKNIVDEKFEGRETLCVIDCNPSFASYTAQALLAADRLIAPCSPDGSSARAISNLGRLIYGINTPDMYEKVGFNKRTKDFEMPLPILHMILLNRTTTYSKKPSMAFNAMFEQIKEAANKIIPKLKGVVEDGLFSNMPDAHTTAIVSSSLGKPIYKLKAGKHELRNGDTTQINGGPFDVYKAELAKIVESL